MIILQEMGIKDVDILFEHTRRLRGSATTKNSPHNEPDGKHTSVSDTEFEWLRESRNSRQDRKNSTKYINTRPTVETDDEESDGPYFTRSRTFEGPSLTRSRSHSD
jgi:hypothetical protein